MEEPQTDVLKEMTDMIYAARNYHNYRKAQELEDLQDLDALDVLEDELDLEPEEEPERRKPGGQPGNQNARTHGFYSRLFPPEELDLLDDSRDLVDCAEDIAAFRVVISHLIRRPKRNYRLINDSFRELARLLAVQRRYRPS
ncbi:MAG: hypothetical protein OXN15_00715 [Chloroflexota bacterium]|nr:hypothetical protein [Chloroflexota bacterium]